MNKKYAVALTVGFLIGMAACGWTTDLTSGGSTHTSGTLLNALGASVAGTVQTVDLHEGSLNIKDPYGDDETVTVDPETQILRNGVPIQMANLRKGDRVLIRNPQMIVDPNESSSASN